MHKKIIVFGIISIFLLTGFTTASTINIENEDNKWTVLDITTDDKDETVDIRVAIFTDEEENEDFYGPYSRTCYFVFAMKNYSWKVNDKTYSFKIDLLPSKELRSGKLTTENYDVLLYPPETAHYKTFTCFTRFKIKKLIEKKVIAEFVEDGGGVFGTCGGSIILGGLENKPDTYIEKVSKNSMLHISPITTESNLGLPLICELAGFNEERIGSSGAYYWYSGWNASDYDLNYHTNVCLDVQINKNHPIFDDHIENTRRIRWVGGGPLVIPENPDREIQVIATFPEEEMSENESTQIHYWTYTGGMAGIIKGLLNKKEHYYYTKFSPLLSMYCFAGDWDKLDKVVETNFANKPFFTTEIYPNENKARIARCNGHPEDNVWWGGYIEDVEDTDYNSQYEAFYKWKDITPEEETEEDEFAFNYCIIRRSVAWASQKVPDNDLPSVYGESQVCDFELERQSLEFTVKCNVKTESNPIEVDLYYRNSTDNISWSEWILFDSDNDNSNGFNFEFNNPNGTGYYEFYSIRKVILDEEIMMERAPPGADAFAYVDID